MKKIAIVLITVLLLFIGVDKVEGIYNGTAGSSTPNGGSCNNTWSYCTWDNDNFTAVRLRLVYYDANTRTRTIFENAERGYKAYYIVNKELHYKNLVEIAGADNVLWSYDINTCGGATSGPVGDCTYNVEWLKNRYSDESNNKAQAEKNMIALLGAMGINIGELTWKNDEGIGYNNSGYRLLIEPVMYFKNKGTPEYATIKEAHAAGGTSNPKEYGDESTLLSTEYPDIGISAFGKVQTWKSADIANPDLGYGYNIINPVRSIFKKCYKLSVNANNPVCEFTNRQNKGSYRETFTKISCDAASQEEEEYEEYGKPTKRLGTCTIYCREEVDVAYPGNILPAIPKGSHFVWPTFGKGSGKVHNLDVTGRKICKAKGDCSGKSVAKEDLYKNFRAEVKLTFKQEPTYKEDTFSLVKASEEFTCDGCDNLWDNKDITVTRKVSLKLPDKKYSYVNKQTLIASDSPSQGITKYTNIGYGNLPVASNTIATINNKVKTYNLRLSNFKMGENTAFHTRENETNYVCKYRLTDIIPPAIGCKCPPGTEYSGIDLYDYLAKGTKCVEAQKKYCDGPFPIDEYCPPPNEGISIKSCTSGGKDVNDCIDENCPSPVERYCPEPNRHISIESCVLAGNGEDACIQKLCNGDDTIPDPDDSKDNGTKYECPKNTPNAFMDISWCVENLIAKGHSEADAVKICQDIVCPLNGIPIIYRTISLRNPFPSKNLNGGIKGFNRDEIGNTIGRYPGTNWNSKELVKAEILENRGVKDEEVYKQEPLYKFVLTGENIRAIRTYNKTQSKAGGYSDFTLDCYGKDINNNYDGSKCISQFIRTKIGGALQGGTCKSATAANTFDACVK